MKAAGLLFDRIVQNIQKRYKVFSNTSEMERALEHYLCPLQMFIELTENGFSYGAFKILKHDLNIKRIFFTQVTLKYFKNIALPVSDKNISSPSNSDTAETLPVWGNIVSIPLFIYGVIYAIARKISRILSNIL
ncbi:MAG: hypothetical protein HQK99_01765 [Nitrospirae bacterium]|nr:hypothetical protein [Nitrospirota bacterium]